VIDLAGMSPINMLQYVRREDAQTEWQHNMDFCPETLNKARARRLGVQGLARTSAASCLCCRGGFFGGALLEVMLGSGCPGHLSCCTARSRV